MLQKLEDFYLGTLRFVVILAATLLLVAVFVMGMKATSITQKQPEPSVALPSVSLSSLKSAVVETEISEEGGSSSGASVATASDPNHPYFLLTAQAIHAYLDRVYPGRYNVNDEALANFAKTKVEGDRSAERQALLAKELARAVPGLLADPAMNAYGKDRDPDVVLNKMFEAFTAEFDRQVAEVDAKNQAAEEQYLADQAKSRQNLLFAAYAFGVFLLIVFLSIIIRIERNLRPTANH
jgi:hypothetical protein